MQGLGSWDRKLLDGSEQRRDGFDYLLTQRTDYKTRIEKARPVTRLLIAF